MDRTDQQGLQHIGLPTACAEVYIGITGRRPDASRPAEMQELLNDVARALAYVVRIYANSGFGVPREIGGQGTFLQGAHVFQANSGEEIGGLTVQRRDMLRAISVLKSAGIRFRSS